MRVTLTGASGRHRDGAGGGSRSARRRGDRPHPQPTVHDRAPAAGGHRRSAGIPSRGPAPADALAGRDAVVNLAGENVAQRWTSEVKQRIARRRASSAPATSSRACGAPTAARALVSVGPPSATTAPTATSASARTPRPATTSWPPSPWPGSARRSQAEGLGMRVVQRADRHRPRRRRGGALATMLRRSSSASAARSQAAGSTCRGSTRDDVDRPAARRARQRRGSPGRSTARRPSPRRTATFSRALGRALHRPAFAPIPGRRHQAPLRRHGPDRREGRPDGARSRGRAGLHVPPSRPRRGSGLRRCANARRQPRPNPRGRASTARRPRRPTA